VCQSRCLPPGPRCVGPQAKRQRPLAAWELGLAGDDVIREIDLDATFDKVLPQSLLLRLRLQATGTICPMSQLSSPQSASIR